MLLCFSYLYFPHKDSIFFLHVQGHKPIVSSPMVQVCNSMILLDEYWKHLIKQWNALALTCMDSGSPLKAISPVTSTQIHSLLGGSMAWKFTQTSITLSLYWLWRLQLSRKESRLEVCSALWIGCRSYRLVGDTKDFSTRAFNYSWNVTFLSFLGPLSLKYHMLWETFQKS